ncbi:MAG: hypothetical protein M3331_06770, partial [Actinomycetota bacterium]|nr:hypothetical protein [Actinomycetota bacterium]
GAAAAGGGGGALGLAGGSAAGLGGATLGAKAVAGFASVALLTAGAVEVQHLASSEAPSRTAGIERDATAMAPTKHTMQGGSPAGAPASPVPDETEPEPPIEPSAPETPVEPETAPPPDEPAGPAPGDTTTSTPAAGSEEISTNPGDSGSENNPPPEGPPVADPPPVDPPPDVDPVPPDAPSSESTVSESDSYEPVAGS